MPGDRLIQEDQHLRTSQYALFQETAGKGPELPASADQYGDPQLGHGAETAVSFLQRR